MTALESVEKNVNHEECFINYLNSIYLVSYLKEVAVFVCRNFKNNRKKIVKRRQKIN